MPSDILLSIGIDTTSLKKALIQVQQAIREVGVTPVGAKVVAPTAEIEKATRATKAIAIVAEEHADVQQKAAISVSALKKELADLFLLEIQGIALTQTQIERKAVLIKQISDYTVAMDKANHVTRGFFSGVNVGRLLLWAIGWTAMYSAMRGAIQSVREVAETIRDLNIAISEVRIVMGETAPEFEKKWQDIRVAIEDTARKGIVSQKELTEAMRILAFEGMQTEQEIAAATKVVRDLMTVTKAKDSKDAVQALAETYGLFRDKIEGATTSEEKILKIGALLNSVYTKGHITLNDYNTMMSRVGLTAAHMLPNFETLVVFLQLMDMGFKGNRIGGMELAEVLMRLSENSTKLSEVFGITFDPKRMVTPLGIIDELRKRLGDTISESEAYYLKEAGFSGKSLEALRFIFKERDAINKKIEENIKLDYETAKAQSERIAAGHIFRRLWQEFIGLFSDVHQKEVEFYATAPESLALREEYRKQMFGAQQQIVEAEENLKKKTQEATEETKKLAEETNRIVVQAYKLPFAVTKSVTLLEKELEIKKLEAIGANEATLSYFRINEAIQKVAWITDDLVKREELISNLTATRSASYEEIYNIIKKTVVGAEAEKAANEYILTLVKERAAVQLKMYEEIKTLADEIQQSTVDFVKNLMTGTANVKDFVNAIISSFRETFAQQIVQIFGEKTGIFATMAAGFMSPIQRAHYSGIKNAVPEIIAAHVEGITTGFAQAQTGQPAAGIGRAAVPSMMTGFMKNISDIFRKQPTAEVAGLGTVPVKPEQTRLAAATKAVGQALGAAAAIYGGVQGIMAQRGVGRGMGALGGALSGAMAGTMIAPGIGTVIGGIVGGIAGMFMGGKKQNIPDEIRQSTIEIKSAIQLSNKELQLITRNTEAMRKGFEGYIFERSAYFKERMGVEERFNLSSRRGLL